MGSFLSREEDLMRAKPRCGVSCRVAASWVRDVRAYFGIGILDIFIISCCPLAATVEVGLVVNMCRAER